jgi:N-acetylglucosamine kinase-like BadF-type ATPase
VARSWPPDGADGLAARIAAHAGVRSCDGLVHWAASRPPAAFATLAPLVCAAATAGDPLAARLTTEAGARLVATLAELPPPDGPVVLAGSLLTRDTPVRAAVLARLPGAVVSTGEPAVAAAWLALRRVATPAPPAAARLHARMLGPAARVTRSVDPR